MQLLLLVYILIAAVACAVELSSEFYSQSCPHAETIVRGVLNKAMRREARSVASVMRFQFHDCFVNGCDGSMLLDDTATMTGEKLSLSNINSLRSYEIIDEMKKELEDACPGVVSCADIIIMASRDAVALSGGPDWIVKLGRNDSLTAYHQDSNLIMPSPRANASFLIHLFHRFNLSVKDLVALSGSHTIGKGRCFSIMFRLYNQSGSGMSDPTIEAGYRHELENLCQLGRDENLTHHLDSTPTRFDNMYFKGLVAGKGFLNSDQTLFTFPETKNYVKIFSRNEQAFFRAFVEGMKKMGDLQSSEDGEVRTNCRKVNSRPVHVLLES